MNEGLGKDFYRKGNSVKRSGPFSEPPDGAYSTRGRSRHLLETPLLRTPSENPSQNPFLL